MKERLGLKEYLRDALLTAGPLSAIGILLITLEDKIPKGGAFTKGAGLVFILVAGIITLWGLFSLFIPLLAGGFRRTFRFCWQVFVKFFSFLLALYSKGLGFILRPAISAALQPESSGAITRRFDWKAHEWRVYPILQRADFHTFFRVGLRVRSLSFYIRPDYRHYHWRAGFRLGPADDDFEHTPIAQTRLFHIGADRRDGEALALWHEENQVIGRDGLGAYPSPKPSFRVDVNIWPTPDEGESGIEISVDNTVSLHRRIPSNYAERITFLAWADGRQFTVYFDSVEIRWIPV